MPGLRRLSPFTLAGDYSRAAARLTAKTSIPLIRYQNYRVDSLTLNVDSDPQKLDYALRLAQASERTLQDTTFLLRRPSLVGNVANNKINTRAAILGDSTNKERLALAGALAVVEQRKGDAYQFAFADDQIINYDTWTAGSGNYVRYNARWHGGSQCPAPDQRLVGAGGAEPKPRREHFAAGGALRAV